MVGVLRVLSIELTQLALLLKNRVSVPLFHCSFCSRHPLESVFMFSAI